MENDTIEFRETNTREAYQGKTSWDTWITCEEDGYPQEQMNGITAFVDASNVHASGDAVSDSIFWDLDG